MHGRQRRAALPAILGLAAHSNRACQIVSKSQVMGRSCDVEALEQQARFARYSPLPRRPLFPLAVTDVAAAAEVDGDVDTARGEPVANEAIIADLC